MENYQQSFIRYWGRGFYYDRSHGIRNNVAIQTYKILANYTDIHKNCRVGCYLMVGAFSKFFSLSQLITPFDLFASSAENDKKVIMDSYPQDVYPTAAQLNAVWRLKYPICFEIASKSMWGEAFGYDFNKAMAIAIDPDDISELEGESLNSFKITVKYYIIDVAFGDKITVR